MINITLPTGLVTLLLSASIQLPALLLHRSQNHTWALSSLICSSLVTTFVPLYWILASSSLRQFTLRKMESVFSF